MFEDIAEMETNGRACGKADKRSIDLARIRVAAFSTAGPEDAEELNEPAGKRIGDDHSSAPVTAFA